MGVLGVRVTFLRHVSARAALSRSGLPRMSWTSSLTWSSGSFRRQLRMKSALVGSPRVRLVTEEASRLVPALLEVACPALVRRLSLSAS